MTIMVGTYDNTYMMMMIFGGLTSRIVAVLQPMMMLQSSYDHRLTSLL